jgi:hypothetical protein
MLPLNCAGEDQPLSVNKVRANVKITANNSFSGIVVTPHNRHQIDGNYINSRYNLLSQQAKRSQKLLSVILINHSSDANHA